MKKATLFILIMLLTGLTGKAQTAETTLKFGYLSYDSVMQSMPQYAEMNASLAELRSQYEAEQKRVEDDFNIKYEEFLDGQAAFPKTILQKRQSELQEMLDKNVAFKKESQRLIAEAEAKALNTLKAAIEAKVQQIGTERGYAFILNTDKEALPFINTTMGDDITADVAALLQQP